ncbi:hypothetical protein, partial [Nocardioides sp. NPDC006273]|uniref:hypothetical protein n=1 Tax=Nocardioides sp. NPDC006273 TaxID=3155598 RepID=UPI0033BD7E98
DVQDVDPAAGGPGELDHTGDGQVLSRPDAGARQFCADSAQRVSPTRNHSYVTTTLPQND